MYVTLWKPHDYAKTTPLQEIFTHNGEIANFTNTNFTLYTYSMVTATMHTPIRQDIVAANASSQIQGKSLVY